ncbi:hypothetical protein DAETH_05790 [Deinococcus aetherius]|uniref:DUF2339 domain-containing protein n=1 Tax=Deinococcus aetherius TaxID=200252 RepID=A0ABM8AAJ1_9DEIO|nr:hypothetical protein [Deinococcus aetherius]BDP40610.1 hypothetical protein DAETH_05790 [Deinococcus aetherius]
MTTLAVVLAGLLALWALVRAARLERRADEARAELRRLREGQEALRAELAQLRGPSPEPTRADLAVTTPIPAEDTAPPPPVWPEDVPASVGPSPARPRGPSLWDPIYSRARISVIGGVLVLGGLAFTLRELGAPGWTRLLAVFAFGALLYLNARRVPWPVSGALRGLGYGVMALGLGSVAQALPDAWGPGVVLAGLLSLSAGLLWDGLRRGEPLLGALAVFGAGLSTWMLTDDLGQASIPAAGAVLLLAGVAVSQGSAQAREAQGDPAEEPAHPPRTALALTLGAAGLVPGGWAVASASHADPALLFEREGRFAQEVLALSGGAVPSLLAWLAFGVLALAPALALLGRRERGEVGGPVPALAAWAVLGPQVLVAAAVGTALSARGHKDLLVLGLALAPLVPLALGARHAWKQRLGDSAEEAGALLVGTVAGSLTAAATGVAGAAVLGLLGARTQPAALSGVALALLLVGLSARSRSWLTAGALGLGLSALWGASVSGMGLDSAWHAALLGAVPAVVGLLGALRVARDPWANAPRREMAPEAPGTPPVSGLTAPLLAGGCSVLLVAALQPGGVELLAPASAALAGGLWWRRAGGETTDALRTTIFWALAPGAALGALLLLVTADGAGGATLAACLVALVSAGSLLGTAGRGGEARRAAELTGLVLLALALGVTCVTWLPALGVPGALALAAALTVPLRLVWGWGRLDVGLGLGLFAALVALADGVWRGTSPVPAPGVLLLGVVWSLTRTAGGLRTLRGFVQSTAAPQRPHVRALWLAALLLVGLLSLGARLDPSVEALRPWLAISSLAVLGVGLWACVGTHRAARQGTDEEARPLWDTGLTLVVAGGLKGALLDAPAMENPGAGVGVAVLVTGLSLLAVAILAPRPGGGRPGPGEEGPFVPPPPR